MMKTLFHYTKAVIVITLLQVNTISLFAQSKAHYYSKFSIIDPTYNSNDVFPKLVINENATPWIYGASELECQRLQVLQHRKDSAKLNVGYPGVFHQPYNKSSFRLKLKDPQQLKSVSFRVVGWGQVYVNDLYVGSFNDRDSFQTLSLKEEIKIDKIRFDLNTINEPAGLLIENENLSTSMHDWEWKTNGIEWEPAFRHPQNFQNVPPHKLENPTVILRPEIVKNNLYDFGRELFGYVKIRCNENPVINVGESEKEALNLDDKQKEQSVELIKLPDGSWRTKFPVAFRFLYVDNNQVEEISCDAIFYPSSYRGAFACSDSILTQIWMNSAYTLRLCMHDFILDGIKRDRLPWTGDLAMSLLVNAYTFSDPELVRRSLVALGRAGIKEQDINGIIDYSLWWIIAQNQYQLYFSDSLHLIHEWSRIKEVLHDLSLRCDSNGFLMTKNETWLFIDWVDQEKWTALQILWWWAQNCGAKLAQRVGDKETADYWIRNSSRLNRKLLEVAWSTKEKIWLSNNDTVSEKTRHPNFLAIISGLATSEQSRGIKTFLENDNVKPVGTPYMAGFEMMALAQLGNINQMLKHVKDYWGGMLKMGATTFWEAYDSNEAFEIQYSFYGRPYGKSLCHAWSAGPAAFLSAELFGLKPLEDGWKSFSVDPNLGHLEWANVCVPTKYGDITVDIKNSNISINIPNGTTLKWKGNFISGPKFFNVKY